MTDYAIQQYVATAGMINRASQGVIAGAYYTRGVTLPKPIRDASAALDQALALRQRLDAETEPPGPTVDSKDPGKAIDAVATWRATIADRRAQAAALHRDARQMLDTAWTAACSQIVSTVADWFRQTAEAFLATLAELDGCTDIETNVAVGRAEAHQRGVNLAAKLTALRNMRAGLSGRLPSGHLFWPWTQFTAVDSLNTALKLRHAVKGRGLAPDPADGSLAWWAQLAAVPGVTLAWHMPAEQAEMYERLRTHHAAA